MGISNPQSPAGNVEAGHGEYPVIGIVSPPCQHGFGTRVNVVQASGIRRASSSPEVVEISAEEAIQLADTSFSSSDVDFMQRMIPHHRQAVEMAALVEERTNREEIVDLAARID